MVADVVECGAELFIRQRRALAGPDHLAPEAEAAIDGARGDELQDDAVAVAVDEAREWALEAVADGVVAFLLAAVKLARIRDELSRDRVGGIARIDECRHRRRDRDRVALSDSLNRGRASARDKTRIRKVGCGPQRLPERGHGSLPVTMFERHSVAMLKQ